MLTLGELAKALGGDIQGDQVLAPGPGHSTKDRSLSVKLVGTNGSDDFIVHSFAGDDPLACKDFVRIKLGRAPFEPVSSRARIVAEYVYRTADGEPYLRVLRLNPKSFRQSHWTGRSWANGKPKGPKIPYRLPELLATELDVPVFVCEGEKDADRLTRLGFVATTASEGAGKWTADLNVHFRGRTVFILADNDDSGAKHAQQVSSNLVGIAAEARVGLLPSLPPKGDVSDWLDAGNDPATLLDLCRSAPIDRLNAEIGNGATRLVLTTLAEVTPKAVDWVWPGRLARGKTTMLAGNVGLGKSQTAIDIAARITTGAAWPDGGDAPLGSVIFLSAEDTPDDTLRPRLDAAGGDPARVHVVTAVREGDKRRTFNLQADIEELRKVVTALGDVVLIIIDPVTSYLGRIDSHRSSDVRAALEPVGEFAATTGVAVLLVSHPSKAVSNAINSVTGSLAFVAMPRMVFLAVPEVGTERNLLLPVKNNLGPLAPGLGYRLIQRIVEPGIVASHVAWDAAPVRTTADEALAALREGNSAMREAREFLADALTNEPLAAATVMTMAVTQGISEITLKRARKALGVVSVKTEFDGGWMWSLPRGAR